VVFRFCGLVVLVPVMFLANPEQAELVGVQEEGAIAAIPALRVDLAMLVLLGLVISPPTQLALVLFP